MDTPRERPRPRPRSSPLPGARSSPLPGARSSRLPGERRTAAQLTERDRSLLAFVADHRLVLASQVQVLLGTSDSATRTRLRALSRAGYLTPQRLFHQQPGCYQVTRRGLSAIGSDLPRPRIDLRSYMHDVGLGWLWLSARAGKFGPLSAVLSERQLRSRDGLPGRGGERLGVRMFGFGPAGREQLHYPDLVLCTPDGKRIAIELELTAKGRARREKILAGYAAERKIDAVVYLVHRPQVARSVAASARKLGISELVHVQPFVWTPLMQKLEAHISGEAAREPTRPYAGRNTATKPVEAGR